MVDLDPIDEWVRDGLARTERELEALADRLSPPEAAANWADSDEGKNAGAILAEMIGEGLRGLILADRPPRIPPARRPWRSKIPSATNVARSRPWTRTPCSTSASIARCRSRIRTSRVVRNARARRSRKPGSSARIRRRRTSAFGVGLRSTTSPCPSAQAAAARREPSNATTAIPREPSSPEGS